LLRRDLRRRDDDSSAPRACSLDVQQARFVHAIEVVDDHRGVRIIAQ
jgi:hypothetical protein